MRASKPASAVDPNATEQVSHLSESWTTAWGNQSRMLRSQVRSHPERHGFARAHGQGRTAQGQQGPPARASSAQSHKMRGPVTDRRGGPRGELDQESGLSPPDGTHDRPAGQDNVTGQSAYFKLTTSAALQNQLRTRGTGHGST